MEELCVNEVTDGRLVCEQFFSERACACDSAGEAVLSLLPPVGRPARPVNPS
jgi:hypothetical protein